MKVLFLAGGYGTRLYPLVKDTPKALLEVCGKTLIDHLLEKFLVVQGIEEVWVVTNAKFHAALAAWAIKRSDAPFPIKVISDGTHTPEERLGAVGDILFVTERHQFSGDWIVAGSDNLFNEGVAPFVRAAQGQPDAVTVGAYDIRSIPAASKYGVMVLADDGRMLSLEEKPQHPGSSLISMCLYYFPATALKLVRQYVEETRTTDTTGGCIQWLYKKSRVFGFKFQGQWYDIGSLESFDDAQKHYTAGG